MCGLSAFITATPQRKKKVEKQLDASLDIIKHRGPDARGVYFSPDYRVGLGHVRLSIIDLSPEGNQPFVDESGGIYAVVNGELYDYEKYRAELSDTFTFKGHSDCEIVIALYKKYGISFLSHLRGEFALVLWDAKRELLLAARDRYGIKSLYYTLVNGRLLVATEMKSFLALGLKPEWDVYSLKDQSWMFGKRTFLKGVRRVLPGHYMSCRHFGETEQKIYWDVEYPDKTVKETRTEEECIKGVRDRLFEAIRVRLRADVPVGVYLSGGLDSSAVAGIIAHLMKEEGAKLGDEASGELKRLKVFTVQFDKDSGVDESDIAKRTADWLGVDFHPIRMTEESIASRFEDVVWHSEAPFADTNGTGKLAMAEMVHSHGIKVVITGEGADENFGGYSFLVPDRFREPDLTWASPIPTAEQLKTAISKLIWSGETVNEGPPSARNMSNNTCTSNNIAFVNQLPMADWTDGLLTEHPETALVESLDSHALSSMMYKWHPLHTALYITTRIGLANALLRYLGDNIDMVHHVESRTPFLDHHLTQYVNSLPPALKIRYDPDTGNMSEKYILKEAVKPFITDEIYGRQKKPFLGPPRFKENGPFHLMISRLITKTNIEGLGFIEWKVAKKLFDNAFTANDGVALRSVFLIAQMVVLGQRFGIKTAVPE
ncbi:hypothetical protein ASPWEDRAFT_106759 [Aspergillus wentii DTO 134E9]|uniref:Glutamine amidotransferase type-2 domain-containing protein n=1 Tax=Aspergillus wentii DTO 134E9 TaxID=1073089 RepID=A0A1L9RNA8_ASPWE|nr:uncharacterized protein ASPWEDRAFT_106759 [Aspergillus wentii DTO 134E9]KAI9926063.1 hypothetical protein MW887_004522 [Aspergillus wentii]OJJ36406.1 hypothetical protein ASPWEDRAFT_106759 [Aspergillus wentii DTO 134E9]